MIGLIAAVVFSSKPDYSFQRIRLVTPKQAQLALQRHFDPKATIPSRAIALYRVRYAAKSMDGSTRLVSGLLALPAGGGPKGLVVYCHGTTADRENVPSRYSYEAEMAVLAMATGGYAVAAPDYLGLGDDPGMHPYPLGKVNADSAIDLISLARGIAEEVRQPIARQTYVTGYSEGGAVAMWVARKLGRSITASAPLSGPYDLTGVQAKELLATQSNLIWFGARFFFGAYVALSAARNPPYVRLSDYFIPRFAKAVESNWDKGLKDEALTQKLTWSALNESPMNSISPVLTPRFRKALASGDTQDPLIAGLAENNVYDWSPEAPMFMVCIRHDFLVSPENTFKTIRTMRQRGVGRDLVRYRALPSRRLTHLNALPSTLWQARKFFDGGFAAVKDEGD